MGDITQLSTTESRAEWHTAGMSVSSRTSDIQGLTGKADATHTHTPIYKPINTITYPSIYHLLTHPYAHTAIQLFTLQLRHPLSAHPLTSLPIYLSTGPFNQLSTLLFTILSIHTHTHTHTHLSSHLTTYIVIRILVNFVTLSNYIIR